MARYVDPYAEPSAPSGGVDLTPRQTVVTQPQQPRGPGYGAPARYPTTSQTPYGQYGYQTPRFPGYRPTSEFAQDPTTANYERLMNFQIPYFMQPVQQTNYLAQTGPQYGNLLDAINRVQGLAFAGPSPGEAMLGSAFGALMSGGNADAYANEYRQYLNQEPFTGAEWEAYRTEALDPIEADRATAISRALREVSDQGIDPSSGIAQAKLREVSAAFDANRAKAQNALAINANQVRAQRKGQAFQAGLSAEQLKKQGQASAVGAASAAANAWANRLGMGLDAAGMGNTAAMQRASMGYNVDQALRGEQNQNFGTAMSLAQIMANLPYQRQQEAMQLIQQNDPQSVTGMYGNLANQRQNQARFDQGVWNAVGSGLGSMASYYAANATPGSTPYSGTVNGGPGGAPMLPGNQWPGFQPGGGFPGWASPSYPTGGFTVPNYGQYW